jgi:protein ImuB
MRRVVSLWLPHFATDRLCRARPEWRDRPLATVIEARTKGGLCLAAVNMPALRAGMTPAMALADARAILPTLDTAPADIAGDARALARLAGWCARYSPWAAPEDGADNGATGAAGAAGAAGVDSGAGHGIWLDITGCAHLFGGEHSLVDDLLARLGTAGYAARAGIADTPGAAWAMARHGADQPPGIATAMTGEARAALEPLPVAALRLTPKTVSALRTLGLHRVGDLLALPRAALAARFGGELAARLDAALGDRPEPLSPLPPPVLHFVRLAFPEPVGLTDGLARAIRQLLDELCTGLEQAGEGARGLVLSLFEPDGKYRRIEIGASRPSRDAAHLARLFDPHLDGIEAAFGIEAVTLAAPAAEPLGARQTGLIGDDAPDGHGDGHGAENETDETDQLIDRLASRFGAAQVVRFAAHESHIPERAQRIVPALAAPRRRNPARWPAGPRPPRLLFRPEAIEAMAPVPDDPPVMFRWRRVLHRVARADGPERITPEWWRAGNGDGKDRDTENSDGARLRDYYRVEDSQGRRFWLYREGLYHPDTPPAWFLHGIFE